MHVPKVLSIDIEHSYNSFRPYHPGFYISCVGLVFDDGRKRVLWFSHSEKPDEPYVDKLKELQQYIDEADVIVAHNLKHDMTILRCFGINFEGKELHCTQVTDYLLEGQSKEIAYSLDATAKRYGLEGKLDKVKAMWETGIDTYNVPAMLLEEYVLDDCDKALAIATCQIRRVQKENMLKLYRLSNEFTFALSDIEMNGFRFDAAQAYDFIKEYGDQATALEQELIELSGEPHFNPASNSQLVAMLYGGTLKTKWKEWTIQELKSKPESKYWEKNYAESKEIKGWGFTPFVVFSTPQMKADKETIGRLVCRSKLQRQVKALLLEYSEAKKVVETLLGKNQKTKSGLLNKLQSDGKIHSNVNQTVAATGRLTSSDPNSQNMPRGSTSPIKLCIVPTYDYIMEYDLSQIEWRAAAELSQDPVMLYEINHGVDQHSEACVHIMKLELTKENRTFAKIFNFRMIYGGSYMGFYLDPRMPNFSKTKWKQICVDFYKKYKVLKAWQDSNINKVWKQGYLQLFTGRKFVFQKPYNERQIKNYPVQGLAGGDILPLLVVIIRRGMLKYGLESKLILTVHDSIVFDVKKNELKKLRKLCESVGNNLKKYIKNYFGYDWKADLTGEIAIGPSYGEVKEV